MATKQELEAENKELKEMVWQLGISFLELNCISRNLIKLTLSDQAFSDLAKTYEKMALADKNEVKYPRRVF